MMEISPEDKEEIELIRQNLRAGDGYWEANGSEHAAFLLGVIDRIIAEQEPEPPERMKP